MNPAFNLAQLANTGLGIDPAKIVGNNMSINNRGALLAMLTARAKNFIAEDLTLKSAMNAMGMHEDPVETTMTTPYEEPPSTMITEPIDPYQHNVAPTPIEAPPKTTIDEPIEQVPWDTRGIMTDSPTAKGGEIEIPSFINFNVGSKRIEVIKNPTQGDYEYLNEQFKEKFPRAMAGDPKTRYAFDSQGNRYEWMSDTSHAEVQKYFKDNFGIDIDQNPSKLSPKEGK